MNNYLYLYPQIPDEQNQYAPQQQNQEMKIEIYTII